MHARNRWRLTVFLLICVLRASPAGAEILADAATLVGSTVTPATRAFEITAPGTYRLTLADVGLPAPLVGLRAAITKGDERVAVLNTAGQVEFAATAGTYQVQVAAIPSATTGLGSFAAQVTSAGDGPVVLDYSDTVTGSAPTSAVGQGVLQSRIVIGAAGNYSITMTDLEFPEYLASASAMLTPGGVAYARLSAANPSATFDAPAGTYDLLVVAQAGPTTNAGLLAWRVVSSASGVVVHDQSAAIGTLGDPVTIALPVTDSYSAVLADLGLPAALSSFAAAIVRGGELLASGIAAGSLPFDAEAGDVQIYALPTPAAEPGVGAMSLHLLRGSQEIAYEIFAASPQTSSSVTAIYQERIDLAAGAHRLFLTDFQFPVALASVDAAVFQGGQELGRRSGSGTLDVQASAGPVFVLVAAEPGASGSGLYGLELTATAGGATVFETTQAAGALLQNIAIEVSTAGTYDVKVTDLQFPVAFDELAAAVSRGTERIGYLYGGGKFSFDATPGQYRLHVVTRVDATALYGMYGLEVAGTPAAPAVTLSASPITVASGDSTTLSWSSTGATSCLASGQWTGSKDLSGSQSSGPITVDSTFTLTCTGPGGTVNRSVSVTVESGGAGGGGGGASGAGTLALLLLGSMARRRADGRSTNPR
jgi:hypothetical protein